MSYERIDMNICTYLARKKKPAPVDGAKTFVGKTKASGIVAAWPLRLTTL